VYHRLSAIVNDQCSVLYRRTQALLTRLNISNALQPRNWQMIGVS